MTYDGPLALATDYMVFNISKDEIKVRMAAVEEGGGPQKLDKVLSYMSDSPDGGIDNGKNQKEAQSTV